MQYAIYLRKSRADREAEALGQGETLARHRAALIEYAERNQLEIGAIYKEIVSGDSIDSRPEMLRLLADVEKKRWAGVLCMDIDRLARGDSADQARISRTFRISGTLIITPSRVYDTTNDSDEEYVDFELFMARREYKAISRRILKGRIASVKEGHFIGSTPPYGYDRVRVEHGRGYTLKPNAESDTVKLIYSLCIGGLGRSAIARRLDGMGIPARSGKAWSSATVSDILRNPVYCGKIRWQFRREEKSLNDGVVTVHRRENPDCTVAEGLHPAIISAEDFDKVQQLIAARRTPRKKSGTELQNPLSGLIYCGMCGRMMTRLGTGAKNRSEVIRCPNRSCRNVSAKLKQVESALIEGLTKWLNDCRVEVSQKPAIDISSAEKNGAEKLRSEISVLDIQRNRIYSFLEQGIYTPEVFGERMKALENQRSKLTERLEQCEREIDREEGNRRLYAEIIPRVEGIINIYAESSPAEKNRLLKTIVSRVSYIKTERSTRRNPDKCSFTLEVMPLLPESK